MLLVQIGLSSYPDKNDQTLPPIVVKKVLIPTQFSSEEEAKVIQELGDNMQTSTTYFASSNAILSILMQTSLSSFWSVINNQ